jgi:transposase
MTETRPSYDDLLEIIRQQTSQIEALQAQVTQLQTQLEELRRHGKRQAAPFRKEPPKENPKKPGRKAGDQHGTHAHRQPPPPAQVTETLDAPLPDACPHCGAAVGETEVAQQFQTEIPRQPLQRQFNIHIGCCTRCGRRVQGRHPLQTSDALGAAKSQIGADAQAAIVDLNKEMGLSHHKIAKTMGTLFGIDLTRGASAQIVLRAAERLQGAHQEIIEQIQGAERLHVDETGWRIGGKPAWLHVWVSDHATCYAVEPKRSADALEALIGIDWQGVLIHDGYSTYDRFEGAIHQQCLFHVLRRAREMLAGAVGGAVRFPRQVIGLFTEAMHCRNEYVAGRVSPSAWDGARDGFEDRLLALVNADRVVPEYEALSDHLAKHFSSWFSLLSDDRVEPTNAVAEQAVRPAVVNRKVWGGNRTAAGAKAQGILTSVLRTCQQQALSAVDFVSQTLRAFGNRWLPRPVLLGTR